MSTKAMNQMETWLADHKIVDIECAVSDFAGAMCGKTLQVADFISNAAKGSLYLPESLCGLAIDGDFVMGDVLSDTEPDVLFTPDPNSLRSVPWYKAATAVVLGDLTYQDGSPVGVSPRSVLQRILGLYAKEGWRPVLAPEFEFYFVKKPQNFTAELEAAPGRVGLSRETLHPYGLASIDGFDDLFSDLYKTCETQRIGINTLTQEAGPAQYEVNFEHGPALEAADRSLLFKRCLRRIALDHGVVATFMAKPHEDSYGSAMHMHQNILDEKTGKNIFADNGGDSELLRNHIAGLQKYLPAVMPLIAPYPNSYRRFVRDLSSPINTHWGRDNRSVGLRVPVSEPQARRVENRLPGADVNCYLAIAASLACGYLGMKEALEPDPPMTGSAYDSKGHALPNNYWVGLDNMKSSQPIRNVLGDDFVSLYVSLKEYEYDDFDRKITPWEREHLLLSV